MSRRLAAAACLALLSAPPASADPAAPVPAGVARAAVDADACVGGAVFDDGAGETGYGWIPSVREGIYVQRFVAAAGAAVDEICVCWLRTRDDASVDFELVVYADAGGQPAEEPAVTLAAQAADVPLGLGGRFYAYPLPPPGAPLPGEVVYVGVRWDAAVDRFFFLCADTSPATPEVPVFYRDEMSSGWTGAIDSVEPPFAMHRALMVRARFDGQPPLAVPALGWPGAVGLAALVAGGGLRRLRRR